jgi:hypothetical protein
MDCAVHALTPHLMRGVQRRRPPESAPAHPLPVQMWTGGAESRRRCGPGRAQSLCRCGRRGNKCRSNEPYERRCAKWSVEDCSALVRALRCTCGPVACDVQQSDSSHAVSLQRPPARNRDPLLTSTQHPTRNGQPATSNTEPSLLPARAAAAGNSAGDSSRRWAAPAACPKRARLRRPRRRTAARACRVRQLSGPFRLRRRADPIARHDTRHVVWDRCLLSVAGPV